MINVFVDIIAALWLFMVKYFGSSFSSSTDIGVLYDI